MKILRAVLLFFLKQESCLMNYAWAFFLTIKKDMSFEDMKM